jgi:hypothetical protein
MNNTKRQSQQGITDIKKQQKIAKLEVWLFSSILFSNWKVAPSNLLL